MSSNNTAATSSTTTTASKGKKLTKKSGSSSSSTAKRHNNAKKINNLQGIGKPGLRRLARKGAVKRMTGNVYDHSRSVLNTFLTDVLKNAVTLAEHSKRKTVTASDISFALEQRGQTIYGYN